MAVKIFNYDYSQFKLNFQLYDKTAQDEVLSALQLISSKPIEPDHVLYDHDLT